MEDLNRHTEILFGREVESAQIPGLAALGMTAAAWRNSPVEEIHSQGLLSNSEMMLANIATYRAVLSCFFEDSIDWSRLKKTLSDPERALPSGLKVGDLADFPVIARYSRKIINNCQTIEEREGYEHLLTLLISHAAFYCRGWYGTPWWPDVVDLFIEGFDQGSVDLERDLIRVPEFIDKEVIASCLANGLGHQDVEAGLARWRSAKDEKR